MASETRRACRRRGKSGGSVAADGAMPPLLVPKRHDSDNEEIGSDSDDEDMIEIPHMCPEPREMMSWTIVTVIVMTKMTFYRRALVEQHMHQYECVIDMIKHNNQLDEGSTNGKCNN